MNISLKKRYPPKPHWRHYAWHAVTDEEKYWKRKWTTFRHIEGWNCQAPRKDKDWNEDYSKEVISYSTEYIEPLPFNNLIVCTNNSEEYFAANKSVRFGKVQNYHRALVYIKPIRSGICTEGAEIFEDNTEDKTEIYSVTRDCTDSRSTYSDYSTEPEIPSSQSGISLLSQDSWKYLNTKTIPTDTEEEDFFNQADLFEYSEANELLSQDLLSEDNNFLPPDYSITVRIRGFKIKQEYDESEDYMEYSKPPAKKFKP
jgi:hypothetical protein